MKTIYHYGLGVPKSIVPNIVSMPVGAELLHVGPRMGEVRVWALVDVDEPDEERRIWLVGTGWDLVDMPPNVQHIGTVQEGGFVWHAFVEVTG